MKILLCFCACLTAAYAHGVISYPVSPFSYSTYISPLTVSRPLGVTYTGFHGYPLTLGPSYFPLGVVPNDVFYTGFPGAVHYFPVAPAGGKGQPDKKKPGQKNGEKNGDKDTKEETTEEPKKEESEPKTDETEDLAE